MALLDKFQVDCSVQHALFATCLGTIAQNQLVLHGAICLASCLAWYTVQSRVAREPNSDENCLDLIFAAPLCEKVIIVPDTNYITFTIREFMLDAPSPNSFQDISLLYEHNMVQSM